MTDPETDTVFKTQVCRTCGAEQPGEYCGACGERRLNPSDRTLPAFLRRSFSTLTDLDSRLLATLRALLFSPGTLSLAYRQGRRKPFLNPLQLFILINVTYFFVQPFTPVSGFNTKMDSHIQQQAYSSWLDVQQWMEQAASRAGMELSTFEVVFNSQSELLAPTLIFLLIPMLALIFVALLFDRRALFVDHLMFSLHTLAYYVLVLHIVIALLWPALQVGLLALARFVAGIEGDTPLWLIKALIVFAEIGIGVLVLVPYLYIALQRFYQVSRVRALFTASSVFVLFMLATVLYRLVLLLTTLLAI